MIASAGALTFDGQSLHGLPSHRVARLGVGLVPEGRRCFASLTVRENLMASARARDWTLATAVDLFPRLVERLPQQASLLSGANNRCSSSGVL